MPSTFDLYPKTVDPVKGPIRVSVPTVGLPTKFKSPQASNPGAQCRLREGRFFETPVNSTIFLGTLLAAHRYRAVTQEGRAEMPYEDGMQLVFDHVERTMVVSFRNTVKMIGPFESQKAAVRAGEQFCRDRGWDDSELPAKRH